MSEKVLFKDKDYKLIERYSGYTFIWKDHGYRSGQVMFEALETLYADMSEDEEYQLIEGGTVIGHLYSATLPDEVCDKLNEISRAY